MYAYHDFRVPDELDDYAFIATHRNPYDRLWSFWNHRNETGNPPVFRTVSWHEYVRWVCDAGSVPRIDVDDIMRDEPVSEMMNPERVDYWLRFEHLQHDWEALCARLGLPVRALDTLNPSRRGGGFQSAYDQWLANRVSRRFERDFELFGYDRDSWQEAAPRPEDGRTTASGVRVVPRPRVAILTNFRKSDAAYSLNRVVQDQVAMLVDHGYNPRVLVTESPHWSPPPDNYGLPGVELVELPSVLGPLEQDLTDGEVDEIFNALAPALRGIDVVLTHDIIYQPVNRVINAAAFRLARHNPSLKWLHWVHSATSVDDLFARKRLDIGPEHHLGSWPNASPVCFSHMSAIRVAGSFHCDELDVQVIPHPVDVCRFFGLSELASALYRDRKLHRADYITTFPVRLDRGKQVEWIIRILARLKAAGESIRILIMDFHSQDDAKSEYRSELKHIARQWDVDDTELLFLSEYSEETRNQAPHSLVRELLLLSNLFIMPSRSESYSLVTQEAAIAGNLLVLNDDFPPLREIYGENALYFKFSSNIDRTNLMDGATSSEYLDVEAGVRPATFPDHQVYWKDDKWYVNGAAAYADYIASRIRQEFNRNKVLAQRRDRLRSRNLYTVFERYLEPMLHP